MQVLVLIVFQVVHHVSMEMKIHAIHVRQVNIWL